MTTVVLWRHQSRYQNARNSSNLFKITLSSVNDKTFLPYISKVCIKSALIIFLLKIRVWKMELKILIASYLANFQFKAKRKKMPEGSMALSVFRNIECNVVNRDVIVNGREDLETKWGQMKNKWDKGLRTRLCIRAVFRGYERQSRQQHGPWKSVSAREFVSFFSECFCQHRNIRLNNFKRKVTFDSW